MTALRTTPTATAGPARGAGQGTALSRFASLGFGLLLVGVFGCGHEPRDAAPAQNGASETEAVASERPHMATLPPPRAEWIEFSAQYRKLNLYPLRSAGRWMVKRSDRDAAYPIGTEHVLPEGIDANTTFVFYQRPGGQVSRSITLAQIQAATREHVSFAR
jgi:hypothetical protein